MAKWLIFLIAMGIAQTNGINIPAWAWFITVSLIFIGTVAIVVQALKKV